MVLVVENCDCRTCKGNVSPSSVDGRVVFGGQICSCLCHVLVGDERERYIVENEELKNSRKE